MGGTWGILGISKGLIVMVAFPGDSHFLLHAIVRATKFSSGSKNQCTGTMITNTGNHFLSHHSLIFFLLVWGLFFFPSYFPLHPPPPPPPLRFRKVFVIL